MMKRSTKAWGMSLVLLILLMGICFPATAEQKNSLALDLVIVLDETKSMQRSSSPNDGFGFRHDAAAALMGLCDVNFSRVAIVPFASEEDMKTLQGTSSSLFRLLPVDVPNHQVNRNNFISLLQNDPRSKTLYQFCENVKNLGTDLGSALKSAVNMLVSSSYQANGNKRVIVLLSDGKIEGTKNDDNSKKVFKEQYELAAQNNIPIYTIGLGKEFSKNERQLLMDAADHTGGECEFIDSAYDIPKVFNQFFMSMVGSEVVKVIGSSSQDKNTNTSTLTIPNNSIAEANILIPVGKGTLVTLEKPDNRSIAFNEQNYLTYSTTYFTLIKIVKPDMVGKWKIGYTFPKDMPESLKKVEANVIFSYDVNPVLNVASSVQKTDQNVPIEVKFMNPDGTEAKDPNLYHSSQGPEFQIKGELTISVDKDGEQKKETVNLEAKEDRFIYSLSIPELYSKFGWEPNSIDTITINAHFNGAGIDKDTEAVVSVENLPPVWDQAKVTSETANWQDILIHDPFRTDFLKEVTRKIELRNFASDPDGDPLTFEIVGVEGEALINQSFDAESGELCVSTNNQTGSGVIRVAVTDGDNGRAEIDLQGNAIVVIGKMSEAYQARIEMDSTSPKTNSNVNVSVKVFDEAGHQITGNEKLQCFDMADLKVVKKYEKNGMTEEEKLDFELAADASCYIASFITSPNAASYEIHGEIRIHGFEQNTPAQFRETELKNVVRPEPIKTENTPPALKPQAKIPNYGKVVIHDPCLEDYNDFSSEWIEEIDVAALVEDKDQETLSYDCELVEGEKDGLAIEINSNGRLKLTSRNKSGKYTLKVTVTDPEQAKLEFKIPVNITNIQELLDKYELAMTSVTSPDSEDELMNQKLEVNTQYRILFQLVEKESGYRAESEELLNCLGKMNNGNFQIEFEPFSKKTAESEEEQTNSAKKKVKNVTWTAQTTGDEQGLVASIMTGEESGTYTIEGYASLQNGDIKIFVKNETMLEAGNEPPYILTDYQAELKDSFEIEPLLWRNKNENTYTINLNGYLGGLFMDSPSERESLTFEAYDITDLDPRELLELGEDEEIDSSESDLWKEVLERGIQPGIILPLIVEENPAIDETDETAVNAKQDEGAAVNPYLLILRNEKAGSRTLLLSAKDKDKNPQRVICLYRQTITSQKDELIWLGLMVLACVAALFVLYQIFYWTVYRKSWKAAHGNVSIFVNNYATGITRNFPRSGKSEMKLLDLRVAEGSSPEMSKDIRKAADCYRLRPGKNGVVIVRRIKKVKANVDVYVGAVKMQNQKKANWPAGASIKFMGKDTLSGNNVEVKREAAAQIRERMPGGMSSPRRNGPDL